MTEVTEEVTTKTRKPKATPAPAAYQAPPSITASALYNHKPTDGDLQAVLPRLLGALSIQAKRRGKVLADAAILTRATRNEDGNWTVVSYAEFVQ